MKSILVTSNNIGQAVIVVFVATIISKIFAYIEKIIVAMYFGTSLELDLFYLAHSISISFVGLFFAGLDVVGVTLYDKYIFRCGKDGVNRFVSALLLLVTSLGILITGILIIGAPTISKIMAAALAPHEMDLLCKFIRILSLVIAFHMICIVFMAILSANKKFIPSILCSVIQNFALIICVIFLSSKIHVAALVLGCVSGCLFQCTFLYLCIRKIVSLTSCSLKNDINCKEVLFLFAPLALGDVSGGVNMLLDRFIAGGLGEGYVSALSYSEVLEGAVSSLFIQVAASVLLPFFSILAAEKRYEEMIEELCKVINYVILILLPITLVTVFMAPNIISVIYERGSFDSNSVAHTSAALAGYGIGFIFKAIFLIIKRPFYAMGNTKNPMYASFFAIIVNVGLTIVLGKVWGVFGIAFATTMGFLFGDLLAIYMLRKMLVCIDWKREVIFLGKIVIAGGICGWAIVALDKIMNWGSMVSLISGTFLGVLVYFFALWILRTHELYMLILSLARKSK